MATVTKRSSWTGAQRHYYETLMDYIHLNPLRAGLIRPAAGKSLLDFAWSSVTGGYVLPPSRRPVWLATEAGLSIFGYSDTGGCRRTMVERVDRRALDEEAEKCGVPPSAEETDGRMSHLRRGW